MPRLKLTSPLTKKQIFWSDIRTTYSIFMLLVALSLFLVFWNMSESHPIYMGVISIFIAIYFFKAKRSYSLSQNAKRVLALLREGNEEKAVSEVKAMPPMTVSKLFKPEEREEYPMLKSDILEEMFYISLRARMIVLAKRDKKNEENGLIDTIEKFFVTFEEILPVMPDAKPDPKKAIVFDAFGTLVAKPSSKSMRYILRHFSKQQFRNVYKKCLVEKTDIAEELAALGETKFSKEEFENLLHKELSEINFYTNAFLTLQLLKLKGYKIGVISNLAAPYKERLEKLNIKDLVDECIFSCDVGITKPNLEIYELMREKLQIEPENILMVGDNFQHDVIGPQKAKFKAMLINVHQFTGVLAASHMAKAILKGFEEKEEKPI